MKAGFALMRGVMARPILLRFTTNVSSAVTYTLTGATLATWNMGDGTVITGATASKTYPDSSQKNVLVRGATSTVTGITLNNGGIVGELDLRDFTNSNLSGISAHTNPGMTKVRLPVNTGSRSAISFQNSGLVGDFDYSGLKPTSSGISQINIYDNSGITSLTTPNHLFPYGLFIYGTSLVNLVINHYVSALSLTAVNKPMPSLQSITFTHEQPGTLANPDIRGTGLTTLDFTKIVGGLSGVVTIRDNTSLQSITLNTTDAVAAAGTTNFSGNTSMHTLALGGYRIDSGSFTFTGNSVLTTFTSSRLGNTPANFNGGTCPLLNARYGFGTKWIVSAGITLTGCGHNQTNVDGNVDDVYDYRDAFVTTAKTFNISGGTNTRPTGTKQQPTGYVQGASGVAPVDGTPASQMEKIWVMENQTNENGTKKYNWTFTTN